MTKFSSFPQLLQVIDFKLVSELIFALGIIWKIADNKRVEDAQIHELRELVLRAEATAKLETQKAANENLSSSLNQKAALSGLEGRVDRVEGAIEILKRQS